MRDDPTIDALDPKNPLIFGCGPLVGTEFPCASRFTVTAKSPLTGIFGDTNAGGFFPVRLKQAGYDHIVIQGSSATPVAILIEKGNKPRLLTQLMCGGLIPMKQTQRCIKNTAIVKQRASARQVKTWCAMPTSCRAQSASAPMAEPAWAASWAQKNLKAIIIKASGTVAVSRRNEAAAKLPKLYRDAWFKGPGTTLKRQYGTLTNFSQIADHTRVKNEQEPLTTEQLDAYDLDLFTDTFKTGQTACYRCPVACTQTWEVKDGPYKGDKGDKVEYGHLLSLGPEYRHL